MWVPLYEGKMVQAYDHRASSVAVNPANVKRPAQTMAASRQQAADPRWSPDPQFWVNKDKIEASSCAWTIALKHISSPTNVRTVITAMCPAYGFGNSVPIIGIAPGNASEYDRWAPFLLANLNCMPLDYVARQKLHGQNLNWFFIEQLPFVPPDAYARRFGAKTAAEIIRNDVLHLTYVSHDMEAFARDQGYEGPPFAWDEEDRLRRRARLDALFFHLYGLDRDAAAYVLGTFPIVAREETQRWGRFRSRDLILAYMSALAAGQPDAAVVG